MLRHSVSCNYFTDNDTNVLTTGILPNGPEIVVKRYDDVKTYQDVLHSSKHLTHNYFLRSFFGDNSRGSGGSIIYESYNMTLKQYLERLNTQGSPMISYDRFSLVRGLHLQLGKKARYLIRCLLKFILDLHNQNFVTTGFNENNVVVVNETPKFFDLITKPRTTSGVTKDFLRLEFLVRNVILEGMDVPTELEDFLSLLVNWRGNVLLIEHHCSIMEPAQRCEFMRSVWDKHRFVNKKNFKLALQDIGNHMKLSKQWHRVLSRDTPLWYVYRGDKHHGGFKNTRLDLCRFMRHTVQHVLDYWKKRWIRVTNVNQYYADQVLSVTYPMVLVEMQRGLNQYGLLNEFIVQSPLQ